MLTFLTLVIPTLFTAPPHRRLPGPRLMLEVSVFSLCPVPRLVFPGLSPIPPFFTLQLASNFMNTFVTFILLTDVALQTVTALLFALSALLGLIPAVLSLIIPGLPILVCGLIAALLISLDANLPLLTLLIILTFNFEVHHV